MNNDVINIVEKGTSTALNITQMFCSYEKFLCDGNKEAKKALIKSAVLSVVGIASLIALGIYLSKDNRKGDILD